ENGQYNSPTHTGKTGNLMVFGSNPNDNPLKFRVRVHNACGWGNWREYHWGDGTTTPQPNPQPDKYFVVAPNPCQTGTSVN
ncbi:hypothetical protein, partial [Flavobacterium silvaticum]